MHVWMGQGVSHVFERCETGKVDDEGPGSLAIGLRCSTFGRSHRNEAKDRVETMADVAISPIKPPSRPGGFPSASSISRTRSTTMCADLPDRGDRARSRLRPQLCRADRARHRLVRRLRRVLAAGRLARRPLEPPQHDGAVLFRLRRLADRRGAGADPGDARDRAGGARHVRRDLSSGRHRDADRAGDHRAAARSPSTASAAISASRSRPASPPCSRR